MLASTKGSLQTRSQRHDFITFMDHRSSTEKLFLFFFSPLDQALLLK
jgi:hypothetical protein